MSSFHEIDNYIEFIISWLEENEIGNSQKKRDKIARDIFIHVCQPNKITIENLKNIKNHISSHEFTKDKFSGNIWVTITEYFDNDPCYKLFFKDLSELRSYGYSTSPNAACGNFELLYRILRPNSRQPTRGDIKDGETEIFIPPHLTPFIETEYKKQLLDSKWFYTERTPMNYNMWNSPLYNKEENDEHPNPAFLDDWTDSLINWLKNTWSKV